MNLLFDLAVIGGGINGAEARVRMAEGGRIVVRRLAEAAQVAALAAFMGTRLEPQGAEAAE